uniref:Zinc finger CCCH-type containing 7B n=1 Tax=Poecilia formosa TaxID=48698 RepID=A0A096MCJ4_POEFO
WTTMESAREKRKEEISRALAFIQSPLAYPDPAVTFDDFLTRLVCNLLEEGNAFFRDQQWEEAVRLFTEALNISTYAEGEEIQIPQALLESLYVNRAAAYHSMGKYPEGVEDSDSALAVCEGSRRALYRKALCLKELGKHKEAYDCTTICLLSNPQDKQVIELSQELASQLGMKIRKPYVSFGDELLRFIKSNSETKPKPSSVRKEKSVFLPKRYELIFELEIENNNFSLPFLSSRPLPVMFALSLIAAKPAVPFTPPGAGRPAVAHQVKAVEDLEVMDDDLDSLLDSFPTGTVSPRNDARILDLILGVLTVKNLSQALPFSDPGHAATSTPFLPAPSPQLPPAFFSSSISQLNSLDLFTNGDHGTTAAALDILDDLYTAGNGSEADASTLDNLDGLDSLDILDDILHLTPNAAAAEEPKTKPGENCVGAFMVKDTHNGTVPNPLSSTHDFLPACSLCFPRGGPSVYSFVHKPDLVHNCKRDVLLCRRKAGSSSDWTRVRPLPAQSAFYGRFVLCRELLNSGDAGVCKYGEKCTFAYNQLEIDVWTEERKGRLDRHSLLGSSAPQLDPVSSIIDLLQEHKGMFIFLCQECYDSKPRIISKRSVVSQAICSNLDARHNFDANKCLAFVMRTHNINYRKVRPFSVVCNLDLCRQAIRYGCQREDNCVFAHSVIELKTWRVQRHTGISLDEIVKVSMRFYDKQLSSGGGGGKLKGSSNAGATLNMKMKFACSQCWRDGLISEPDKGLKYCTAKARHAWTKERRVLLVRSSERSKWVNVRPLPHAKNFPLYYDMCAQVLEKRKCNYTGNCSFAHSQEEREMWMYMKNNELYDMEQVYNMWLALAAQNRQSDGSVCNQSNPEEKFIAMPTDFAEQMDGFHCRLCGKHSNSERQWQQHISSEKHKDRVFSCEGEDEALTWSYRFPGACFKICPKIGGGGCPDGVSCDYAHGSEELQEWIERRDFLRQKLAKAREDMLIMPDELDFGKYNFLLQD